MFCLFLTVSLFFIQPCWPGSGASQRDGHRAGAPTRHFGVDGLFRKPGDLGIPAALALPREPGSMALVSARAEKGVPAPAPCLASKVLPAIFSAAELAPRPPPLALRGWVAVPSAPSRRCEGCAGPPCIVSGELP